MNLPESLSRLFARLAVSAGEDVAISDLLQATVGRDPTADEARLQQQLLGPYITRLNRRLHQAGLAVKPGRMKRTYRLVAVG